MGDQERIWKLLFGDKPMPEQREGAVDDAFGMFSDRFGELTEEEFAEVLREIKGKGFFSYKNKEE